MNPNDTHLSFSEYSVLEAKVIDGITWHSVSVTGKVSRWMEKTFIQGKDYTATSSLKGVWYDVTDNVLIMIKLKWTK